MPTTVSIIKTESASWGCDACGAVDPDIALFPTRLPEVRLDEVDEGYVRHAWTETAWHLCLTCLPYARAHDKTGLLERTARHDDPERVNAAIENVENMFSQLSPGSE